MYEGAPMEDSWLMDGVVVHELISTGCTYMYLSTSADGLATYILLAMQMNLNSPVQEGNYMINLVHVYAD